MEPDFKDFTRYLEAKKVIDDRSLNHEVWKRMVEAAGKPGGAYRPKVLEIGCGIGTMLQRMVERKVLTNADYTGIDIDPELIAEARVRLEEYAPSGRPQDLDVNTEITSLRSPAGNLDVLFEVSDIFDFVARYDQAAGYDIILAHAFMDLVDPASSIPLLLSLLNPGKIVYLTLNFDGVTVFEPLVEPELDDLIIRLYHETMDRRCVNGKPSGSSTAGRLLPLLFRRCLVETLAAGSSDWVLISGSEGYSEDEVYFLHFIIRTVHDALSSHPALDEHDLDRWTGIRHDQIDRGELIYMAHQIDILGRKAGAR